LLIGDNLLLDTKENNSTSGFSDEKKTSPYKPKKKAETPNNYTLTQGSKFGSGQYLNKGNTILMDFDIDDSDEEPYNYDLI
jgi:hypothetical protein